jgi:hypothetical protein
MKKTNLLLLLLSFCLFALPTRAQNEATVWYFGQNAGISFANLAEPQALKDSKLFSEEGSAVLYQRHADLE